MPVTILALAEHRLGHAARTSDDFEQVGLAIMGGCERCGATIAAYNAYPSTSGFWRCDDCIGDDGWETVDDAAHDIFGHNNGER